MPDTEAVAFNCAAPSAVPYVMTAGLLQVIVTGVLVIVSAAVLVAEIGDVSRFPTPQHLCSWVGLTPKHRESDLKTRRGRISKQGSRLVRATLIEGISRYHGGSVLDAQYRKLAKRRGRNKARIALARKVLTLVYYGLRDGDIRCLAPAETAA